jgi:hypothetical protein
LLAAFALPVVVVGVMVGSALSAPAQADAVTRPLLLKLTNFQFGPFTCLIGSLETSCLLAEVTVVGPATSNLSAGTGTYQSTITIDFTPGDDCNIVDEPAAFTFDNGTIFTHSHHEDCNVRPHRIDTTFQVTGGTGAFAGATGTGHEFGAGSPPDSTPNNTPIIYVGTITF